MKTFQQALEVRVKNGNKSKLGRHTLEKATKDVIQGLFGDLGAKNIRIECRENNAVFLKSNKSVWRSELKINSGKIRSRIKEIINHSSEVSIIISK